MHSLQEIKQLYEYFDEYNSLLEDDADFANTYTYNIDDFIDWLDEYTEFTMHANPVNRDLIIDIFNTRKLK